MIASAAQWIKPQHLVTPERVFDCNFARPVDALQTSQDL
jgi:hypothetical protein